MVHISTMGLKRDVIAKSGVRARALTILTTAYNEQMDS
jgi:hypothetical protein